MFVHGPSRICTHPSLMPIETFAFVFTGGKIRGCEKAAAVGAAARNHIWSCPNDFGAAAKRTPIPANAAASIIANKVLSSYYLPVTTLPFTQLRLEGRSGPRPGRGVDLGVGVAVGVEVAVAVGVDVGVAVGVVSRLRSA